ncbi:Unknown protein sequence [Pseudomonas savastanoi pv. phaseolicola]|nr:Unknown protein sequence [Pseudomonas savastanoi pv. phaseolicola]
MPESRPPAASPGLNRRGFLRQENQDNRQIPAALAIVID